jgi:hypothetical protein
VRVHRRLRGKLHSVLEKLDHGHQLRRLYCKNFVGHMYRSSAPSYGSRSVSIGGRTLATAKGLENLERLSAARRRHRPLRRLRSTIPECPCRLLAVSARGPAGHRRQDQSRRDRIKIQDTRMMRLMEVLLLGGTQLNG